MKKLVSIIILCLGCMGILGAQDIWKPIDVPGTLLGVTSDGSIFAYFDYFDYGEIARSQDEGETWQVVLSSETEPDISFLYDREHGFTISEDGKAFVVAEHHTEGYLDYYCLFYSDDNGDTWQNTAEITELSLANLAEIGGIAAPTNDIILVWTTQGGFAWTLDSGANWNYTFFAPPHDGIPGHLPHELRDVIVNASGDLYATYLLYSLSQAATARTNISEMSSSSSWQGLEIFDQTVINDMEFDPEGNALMGYVRQSDWTNFDMEYYHGDGYYVFGGQTIAVSDNGVIYKLRYTEDLHAVLNYSLDHGENFFDVGEAMEISQSSSSLFHDGNIYKGKDNHLYFHGNGQYYKSVHDADHILNHDNTHYVDAIQICGTDGQTQFPLTINVENAESGPNYGCLYLQPNPSWFFVKMDEPGDVIININAQSEGGFFDVDFCCWGPFNALPESSEELTQDKVVDCSYNSSVPITCTIPSEAQTGEYYVLVVTNYANMPGDLIFAIDGTGSLECPGTHPREWYYEIQNENGSITYQYMYQAGDTIVQDEPTHILVKINTLYDKDVHTEVTHEYVYEREGKLYWWNKTLEEFTVLYDFSAEEGDEWEIKVGTETLDMYVDAVEQYEYDGKIYRMLHVSDPDDLFSGDIVCGIGHLTSFFPERLMDNGDGIRVEGLRCYWVEDELVFKSGDEDCDAIYEELHGIEEGPSTDSGLTVYPNPTDGVLVIETQGIASLQGQTYRISNLTGQSIMTGQISAETQQINVSSLPQGMYFITVAGETRKFVVR